MKHRPFFSSILPENAWPALMLDQPAQLLATAYQMEQSQWWNEASMLEAQALQLARLVSHARQHVPYYRTLLPDLGDARDAEAFWGRWRQLPLLSRELIQEQKDRLATTVSLPGHGKQRAIQTSGSTGRPINARSNELVDHFYRAIGFRDFMWHMRDPVKKLSAIRSDRDQTMTGRESKSWGRPLSGLFETGPSSLLYSGAPMDYQVQWLLEQQPDYLLSTPSNFMGLIDEIRRSGKQMPHIEQLISFAETLSSRQRKVIEEFFAAPVVDMYSSVEVGYIALQCPEHPHLHVQSEVVLVEVLDDDGRPCAPGDIGRIILTPLHNFATPLIRYEIGDYVEMGEPCSCGRGLPVIKRVMGRIRNLLTLPNGQHSWPYLGIAHWSEIAPIRQGQVVQKSLNRLEIRLVAERTLDSSEQQALADHLAEQVHHRFELEFSYHDELVRGRNRKFEDFISEIDPSFQSSA